MKAKLTVTCNNQTKAYALPEQGVKIGRDPGQCQLALQDPDVSSLHAFMCCKNGAWMLQDLGSTNGTYVNGNKITTVGLKSGDRIKFGNNPEDFRQVTDMIDAELFGLFPFSPSDEVGKEIK